jgi:hypothetical protein
LAATAGPHAFELLIAFKTNCYAVYHGEKRQITS